MAKPSRTATTAWRRIVREVRKRGRETGAPCHLCRGALGPIDYRTQSEANREAADAGRYWEINTPRPLALHVDHLTPHAAGGQDSLTNAAPSHALCNTRAGAKQTTRQASRSHTQRPVNGTWQPRNGQGPGLPGRATPGAHTATHVFVPTPTGATPSPTAPERPPSGQAIPPGDPGHQAGRVPPHERSSDGG